MDNLTHTLAGLALADVALQLRTLRTLSTAGRFRGAFFTTSVLANNGPDLDFIYTGLTGGKLGYLLHHRGHTHTFIATPVLAVLFWACVVAVLRLLGHKLERRQHLALLGVALLGSVLHILLDFGNNYGVHPFWPLDSNWYYGDAIYIVEPWLMLMLAGSTLGATTSPSLRAFLLVCVAGLLALAWRTELAGPLLASLLTLFALVWCAASWRARAPARAYRLGAALVCFWLLFLASRARARDNAATALGPHAQIETLSSTPSPGNPFCWWVVATSREGEDYVIRQALSAAWPELVGVEQCRWASQSWTAPLAEPTRGDVEPRRGLDWGPEFRAPLAELAKAAESDCVARAFLRYARIPFWLESGGRVSTLGDFRYDRSRAIDFAEIQLTPNSPCPKYVPPWQPPLRLPP